MPPSLRLGADALASELAKLPSLTTTAAPTLDAVRIALARAIASGQSADQIAADLGVPAAWQGIDLSNPPAITLANASSTANAPAAPATTEELVVKPAVTTPLTPPDWAAAIVPLALAKDVTTRVVVLDQEPSALGGLEMPSWARALKPSATIGPITVSTPTLQVTTLKWIIIFTFSGTVEFVRGGTVLCVVPVSILSFGPPTEASINAGSAWIAVNPFDAAAAVGSFAGIAVQSGTISSDQAFSVASDVVTVPAGASLSITLAPAPVHPGQAGFPAKVGPPATISISFPATGTPTAKFSGCSATLYGEHIGCSPANLPVVVNSTLNLFYIPGHASVADFKPKPVAGKMVELSGSAKILSAGWALYVSQSATPLTLGTAFGSGEFAMAFGAGVAAQWTGLASPEAEAGGFLVADNTTVAIELISGSPVGVLVEQKFALWLDQDSLTGRSCELVAARQAGQVLTYALSGVDEILEIGAVLEAQVDRPVLASGARVPAVFVEGIVMLRKTAGGNRLMAFSAAPVPETVPKAFPMALDNALLEVSEPLALYVFANTDADFNAKNGICYLLFAYLLAELYLPDPYTGGLAPGATEDTPASFGIAGNGESVVAAFLLSSATWTTPDNVALRLSDTAHTHPVQPPTSEASSDPDVPGTFLPGDLEGVGLHPIVGLESTDLKRAGLVAAATEPAALQPQFAVAPTPPALPEPPEGVVLLDLSTRASQLGVEVVTGERQDLQYTIDGLSVRGPAHLLPLTTLPAIAWEPMYNLSTAIDGGVKNTDLLHPPNDGPFTQVRATTATLIPIAPLQSLQAVLDAGPGGFNAQLTLPFGMVGALDTNPQNGTILSDISLVQPSFSATLTPTGLPYTGAWQLSFSAPDPSDPDPVLSGRTYLRTPDDNPATGLSYGEMVLGTDVAGIFSSRFDPPEGSAIGTGVPLRRYDLTGYGASTFSEWTNTNPAPTDVIKTFFHVLVGRTSHEVIQVQSVVYPWAIKVVRTITIDRQASGSVQRYDSGWQAASDGVFQFPTATGITAEQVHAGLIGGVISVKNIQQLGLPMFTQGSPDTPGAGGSPPQPMSIQVQPVTFDADVIIQPQHVVTQGGVTEADLNGNQHACVPSTGITGYIGLQYDYHLSMTDMVNFPALAAGAGGPINATINVGGANSLLRATEFDATPIQDTAVSGGLGLACAVRGIPKLSSDGSWSVASRTQSQTAPVALAANAAAPVVQPNTSGGSTPGSQIHYADPADIFRLAPGFNPPPQTLYGFLQSTGTQSNLLSRPILTVGSQNLTLGDALNVAHAGALLGAIGNFPGIAQCLQFLESDLSAPIVNQLTAPSLATTQNLYLKPSVRSTPIPLISTSIADVSLYFYQQQSELSSQADPANVVISLGQPTSPSWSLDVNHLAIGLLIPALSNTPVIWFEGSFHADADSTPGFPNLQVDFSGPLSVLTTLFTVLDDIASVLSPGGSSGGAEGASGPPGLNVTFSDGKLTVTDNFALPSIPLGLGTIENVSLDIGASLDIVGLSIDFLVGIGSPTAPVQWIADPLSGTICVQAGVQNNEMTVLIQAGIGLGLSIDLGIASGSASIVVAVQLQINGVPGGAVITIMLLLTGQASVDVLGGLASAAITLTAGLGFSIDTSNEAVDLIGTAAVGIHISICWVINISWSGSWTFQKQLPFDPLTVLPFNPLQV
jgi:hypothetical protein